MLEPGLHAIPVADYLALPALSSSLARVLLSRSPRHAWWCSPALNPAYEPEEADRFDVGTCAHAYLLEGATAFAIIEADDFRTKAAKEARDNARAAGKTPILASRWADVQAMAEAVHSQLARHEAPIPFTDGHAEHTLIWREGDVLCKARPDWLHADRRTIDDLKSTDGSANPDGWTRGPLFALGYDIQASWYLRGLKAVTGMDGQFRFVVAETRAPYGVSVVALSPAALALAERKCHRALELWRHCLDTGTWPGYPERICYADLPPWEETRWMEREGRAPVAPTPEPNADDGRPLADQLFGAER